MMRRRAFAAGLCGCSVLALAGCVTDVGPQTPLVQPGHRPEAGDEAAVWYMADKAEAGLRNSPYRVHDRELNDYVAGIVCRLADAYCRDIRVYLVRRASFNAAMWPNGAMEVNTGFLLRSRNEAQIAAVLGHEIGHYALQHSLEKLRDIRGKMDAGMFMSIAAALAGAPQAAESARLSLLGSVYAFSRHNEREADRYGIDAMARAGYAAHEVPKVWEQLRVETEAVEVEEPERFFATHPSDGERRDAMQRAADALPLPVAADPTYRARMHTAMARHRLDFLTDEIRSRRPAGTLVLLDRLEAEGFRAGEIGYARGEVYRLRARPDDIGMAIAAYEAAIGTGEAPPEAWRGLGLLHRRAGRHAEAQEAFARYLALRPDAPDAVTIGFFLQGGA